MRKLVLLTTVSIASMTWALVNFTHAATPTEINVLYQNPLIFDASGRLLGAYTAGGAIVNSKGFQLNLYTGGGHFVNWPIFFESSDCSGSGYTNGGSYGDPKGHIFITNQGIDQYFVAFTDEAISPTNKQYQSLRRYVNGVHGACETKAGTALLVPVFPNDPEITGVPSDLGTRDNPYPVPFYFERYLP